MNQKELTAILQKELEGKQDIAGRGVWTVDHCIRVSHLVLKLRKAVGASAKLDSLLFVAGLFHDVSHDSVNHQNHGAAGAVRMKQLLAGKVNPKLLNQAAAIVAVHDDRRPDDGRDIATHLVQDADMLDHFGTLRIWADFGFATHHDLHMTETLKFLRQEQKMRVRYKSLLHFAVSQQELESRLDFEAMFLKRADKECRDMSGGELV